MNNDKYAKYSSGKVTFGSNGAYTSSRVAVAKKSSGCGTMAILLLALVVTGLMFGIKSVHAMGITESGTNDYVPTHETANPCVPYTHAMVNKGAGFWSHTITLTHGTCNGTPKVSKSNDGDPTESVTVPAVNTVQDDKPASQPKEDKHNDKPKCNNGEGNGGEGCSPAKSPNANNDENDTTPKQDKSKHASFSLLSVVAMFLYKLFVNPVQVTSDNFVVLKPLYTKRFHLNWYWRKESRLAFWANSSNERGYHAYYIRIGRLYLCPTLFI